MKLRRWVNVPVKNHSFSDLPFANTLTMSEENIVDAQSEKKKGRRRRVNG